MVVSLPSDVVKKYGLKKGQELEVEENNGKISIFTGNRLCKEPCELRAKEELIKEQLESLYTQGYDEVKVYYENKNTLKKIIQNINKKFIGFQVLDSNGEYCTIKSIAVEDDTKLSSIIRRVFLILLNLIENNDEDDKENLIKLINVCKRMLNQKNHNFNEIMPVYNLITVIEDIIELDCRNKKMTRELIEQIYNIYYKFDEQESIKIKDKITKELTASRKDSNTILFLYNTRKMLDLITAKNLQIGFYNS